MAKSKFFRVAVEGATSDGRVIDRTLLQDMASSYNPSVYGARIFAEHIRGIAPGSPFKAYGDVTAVKAEEIADGPLKGKLALYAQIDPTPEMVGLVKSRQKIYSSMEITPKFADTGRAYLSGLGITDSPASLGTEVLTFAAQHPAANPFASRKQAPDNLFSAAELAEIEFEEEASDVPAATLFKSVKDALAKLAGKGKADDGHFAEVRESLEGVVGVLQQFADSQAAATQQFADKVGALVARVEAIETASSKAATDFAALKTQLEAESSGLPRPPATGGADVQLADC